MATTIAQQLSQPYVGEVVDLFHLDLRPIGQNLDFYFTPSSDRAIKFNNVTYQPLPISISGLNKDNNAAPGRVNLTVSNLTYMLAAMVVSYGDLVGARLNYTRTMKNFLDGQENGGTGQAMNWQRYIIFQKNVHNQEMIQWVLSTELDRPDLYLPLRQCLKSDIVGNSLWCPGMQRTRL